MRFLKLLSLKLLAVGCFATFEIVALLIGSVTVMALDPGLNSRAPNVTNSQPDGAHVFLLRISSTEGVQRVLRLSAYYNTQANGSSLTFSPSAAIDSDNVCSVSDITTGYDVNKYFTVTLTDGGAGGSNQRVYHVSRDDACRIKSGSNNQGVDGTNAFYAQYQVPNTQNVDPQTNMYKVNIEIAYNDGIPKPTTGGFQQRLVVTGDNNPKIGQLGGSGRSFPIVVDWNKRDEYYTGRIEIPFGLPCNQSATDKVTLGVYDSDNGDAYGFSPREVKYGVFKDEGSGWQRVSVFEKNDYVESIVLQDVPGTAAQTDVVRAKDGTSDFASVKMYMEPDVKYKLVVFGIAPRNTIDIQIPHDAIFGDISCGWRMKVDSSVNGEQGTVEWFLGDAPVTFKHVAQNVGAFKTDDVQTRVFWANGRTGTQAGPDTKKYDPKDQPGSDKIYQNTFTPLASDVGKTICQYLRATPHSLKDTNAIDSAPQACVHVNGMPPVPTNYVNITPVVDDGPDIEPTETTTLNGRVIVSSFPNFTDWGYTEKSKRLDAQRVTPTMTSFGIGTDTRTVYTCPSGYSPTGTYTTPPTCSKTVPGTTTYYCPHGVDSDNGADCKHSAPRTGDANNTKKKCEDNGNTWTGGSCYSISYHPKSSTTSPPTTDYASPNSSTQYRYRCEDPTAGAWGAWGGPIPTTCKKQYTCPGGAKVSGTTSTSVWRTSAPTCDGWKCQYPSAQINQAAQPTCEYRCQSGTGSRAYNNNGSSSSPCYVPPTFSLRCKWDSGETVDATVTGDGIYCTSSVQRVGVTIGSLVCATLTYNKPAGWSPSDPRPGYGLNSSGTMYGQWKEWGWHNPGADSGCSRVVAKPTVKINGGDVVAGAAFTQNGICSPVSTGSVVGWPHEPDYNASYGELGVFARGSVTGFASSKISSNPQSQPPRSLVFANYPALTGQNYGGNFGNMKCIPDHYGNPTGLPSVPLTSIGNSTYEGAYVGTGGQINTSPIAKGQHLTVYVNGSVYITGTGVRYQERGAWITTDQIPAFKLVVRGGNIYIDPSVQQLDGIYVAQPSATGVGGNIYTCATSSAPYTNTNLYNNCRANQLVVNGAFIAKKVHLLRTQGTAIFGQTAEQFNYLPELWTAQWPATSNSSADELKYDSVLSLPPVL